MLLDNGRTAVLGDPAGRAALRCIRCSACLNVCPVYERTGGHAYGSVYPGPIGAVLSPQLTGPAENATRCRSRPRCAAPATTPARWRSTSRRCSCTCAAQVPQPRRRSGRSMRARRVRDGVAAPLGRRAVGLAGGPPAGRAPRPDPGAAAAAVRLDREPRPARPARRELPRLVDPDPRSRGFRPTGAVRHARRTRLGCAAGGVRGTGDGAGPGRGSRSGWRVGWG